MSETLNAVRNAIDNGNYARAREVLRPVLRENTSAEAWVLAAQLTDSREKKQQFLRRALAIDPMHLEANRQQVLLDDIAREFAYTPVTPRRRRFPRAGLGCVATLLLGLICSAVTFSAIGLLPGSVSAVVQLAGGPTPVYEIDGVSIADLPEAAQYVPVMQSLEGSNRMAILDHGHNHEYTFNVQPGQEIAIYVQFVSTTASAVKHNIAILNPAGQNTVGMACIEQADGGVLPGESSATYLCIVDQAGTWRGRILGVQGESTGAYFIGVAEITGVESITL